MKRKASLALRSAALGGTCVLLIATGCAQFATEVDFLAEPQHGSLPFTTRFTPLTEGEIGGWVWSFGDGFTSTERSPEHTYAYVGAYSVTLLVKPRHGEPASARKDHFIQVMGDVQAGPWGGDVRVLYENHSSNSTGISVVVLAGNDDAVAGGHGGVVAWRVLPNIGNGSMIAFDVSSRSTVRAVWRSQETDALAAEVGKRYAIESDPAGIVLVTAGAATSPDVIEVVCHIEVEGGVRAQLLNDRKVALTETLTTQGEMATFVPPNKLYWLITGETEEGSLLDFATLSSCMLFEQDITELSSAAVTLIGNPKDGYQFETPKGDV